MIRRALHRLQHGRCSAVVHELRQAVFLYTGVGDEVGDLVVQTFFLVRFESVVVEVQRESVDLFAR